MSYFFQLYTCFDVIYLFYLYFIPGFCVFIFYVFLFVLIELPGEEFYHILSESGWFNVQ